jgi:hypothetical protein
MHTFDCSSFVSWSQLLQDVCIGSTIQRGTTPLEIAFGQGETICSLMDLLRSGLSANSPYQIAAELQSNFAMRKWVAPLSKEGTYSASGLRQAAVDGFIARNSAAASGWKGSGLAAFILNDMRRILDWWLPAIGSYPHPKFGPGAVFEKFSYFRKRQLVPLAAQCHQASCAEHAEYLSLALIEHPEETPRYLSSLADLVNPDHVSGDVCRLCDVPKSWKARRLITVEPFELALKQQAARSYILKSLESGPLGRRTFWRRFELLAPTIQRRKAIEGSRTGKFATIDLSAASDGIDLELVCATFPQHILHHLVSSRSTHFVCDGTYHEMNIYAGMGNATTFMVETLFFQALMCAVARRASSLRVNTRDITTFGDDIIVPTNLMRVIPAEGFGRSFRINPDKSFWTGAFRESCGVFAYNGIDVTPVNIRGPYLGTHGQHALSSLWHTLRGVERGGSQPQAFLASSLLEAVPWGLCCTNLDVCVPGYPFVSDGRFPYQECRSRYNRGLQRWELRVPSSRNPGKLRRVSDQSALDLYFLDGPRPERTSTKSKTVGVECITIPDEDRIGYTWVADPRPYGIKPCDPGS